MACTIPTSITSISDFLVWPTTCHYYFWLLILGVIFIITAWTIFKSEEKRKGEGEMISAIGVSSIATTILGAIATLIKDSNGIPMLQPDLLLIMVAATVVIVMVWIFKD